MAGLILRHALILAAVIFLAGCYDPRESGGNPTDGESAVVLLNIRTPQASLPSRTRAQTEDEARISEVRVFVFEQGGSGYEFAYHVAGSGVTGTGFSTTFRANIIASDEPTKLLVVANGGDIFSGVTLQPGTPELTVRTMITNAFTTSGIEGDLPMYGEALLPDGISPTQTYSLSLTALRAVARVDIVKDIQAGNAEFILEEVYIYRANDKLRIIPDGVADITAPKVTAPSVPSDAQRLAAYIAESNAAGAESFTGIYLPESEAAANDAEKLNGVTTIVVGGRYGGSGSDISYYRADFNPGVAGHPFGQILRNHRYVFNIKSVSADGWESPDLAANNFSSAITVAVQAWEDFSTDLYFGNDRFAISSRSISLRFVSDRTRMLDVESTVPYTIQWVDAGGNPTSASTGVADTPINDAAADAVFEAYITNLDDDGENVSHLAFRTLQDNYQGSIITRKLRITAGNWTADITVTQDNVEMYKNRFFNVLTADNYGNMGISGSGAGSAEAMRRMLEYRFTPTGTVKIGGFSFNRVPSSYPAVTSATDIEIMRHIIGDCDVLYFPYDIRTSSQIASVVYDWLDGDTRRVLIIASDSQNTNAQLRAVPRVVEDGTWGFSNIANITNYYARAAESDQTKDFFNGPFGEVSSTASIRRIDDTSGYLRDYPATVTPLLVSDEPAYSDYMFFGVNRSKRIVYHGDVDLFTSGVLSNNSGNVNTDADRLMANTWSWITEQLIYGDE